MSFLRAVFALILIKSDYDMSAVPLARQSCHPEKFLLPTDKDKVNSFVCSFRQEQEDEDEEEAEIDFPLKWEGVSQPKCSITAHFPLALSRRLKDGVADCPGERI